MMKFGLFLRCHCRARNHCGFRHGGQKRYRRP